ncbi:MAG: hypothetical protein JOZ24_00390 [Candidatus Eremiobacteraeota bacterium]|nr:hypothetical protein [Candidatus Eremiobacteraeota bacterium]
MTLPGDGAGEMLPGEDAGRLPPCDRFTVLKIREFVPLTCDVCDHPQSAHAQPGRRIVSGGEMEELRRSKLVELYESRGGDAEG